MNDDQVSYEEARKRNLVAATTLRVFGIPLRSKASEGYLPVLWCGISVEGAEHREATNRIWHLPEADIVGSGEAEGFRVEGHPVHWYDLKRESTPVEESYTPISLTFSARLFLGSRFGGGSFGGAGTVPVTIDPTAGPTGTKVPTTITP